MILYLKHFINDSNWLKPRPGNSFLKFFSKALSTSNIWSLLPFISSRILRPSARSCSAIFFSSSFSTISDLRRKSIKRIQYFTSLLRKYVFIDSQILRKCVKLIQCFEIVFCYLFYGKFLIKDCQKNRNIPFMMIVKLAIFFSVGNVIHIKE